jgi:hypothetical protein
VRSLRMWRTEVISLALNAMGAASLGLLIAINMPHPGMSGGILEWVSSVGGLVLIIPLLLISYLTFQTSVARVEDANHHLNELNKLYLSTV